MKALRYVGRAAALLAGGLLLTLAPGPAEPNLLLGGGGATNFPVNTTPPTLSGTPAVGQILTCGNGVWTGSPTTFTPYQWLNDGVIIGGQTANTYTVVSPADPGHTITCKSTATNGFGSTLSPPSPGLAIPGASPITLAQPGWTANSVTNPLSLSVTISGTTAGNLLTVEALGYISAGSPPTVESVTLTPGTTTCTLATGATQVYPGNMAAAYIYYCPNIAAPLPTSVTMNCPTTSCGTPTIRVQEWAGALTTGVDDGKGAGNIATGVTNSPPASVATSAATTQANELIISTIVPSASAPTTIGAGQIAPQSDNIVSYTLINAAGVATHTYGFATANNAVLAIAAFKHP